MPIKAIIFDLDGTITRPYLDFDVIRCEMGMPKDSGPILEALERMSDEDRQRAERIIKRHEEEAIAASELNDGAVELLAQLHERGLQLGILTRNTRENAKAVLSKHALEFDCVVGRDEAPVKPDAAGVLLLCRHFGVSPQESLVIGDYLFDVLSANAAGATSVLLSLDGRGRQFTEHADFTVKELSELVHIVDRTLT
ncbi:HAD family hydrolase [Planctomycetota bacterium]